MKIIRARCKIVVSQRNGFTLIELLVVISIIAVLFAVVLIAINPAKRFAEANNARRQSDVRSLSDAIAQYIADKRGQTPDFIPETPTCVGNGETLNGNGGREIDPSRDSAGLVGLWHFNANEGKELSNDDLEIFNNGVSLWHLNEGAGQSAADNKGVNNGTLGATSGAEASDPSWTDSGKFSKALTFNGTDEYVSMGDPDNVDFGSGDFTLEAWTMVTDFTQGGQEVIIGKDNGSTDRQFFLMADGNNTNPHKIKIGYCTSLGCVSVSTNSTYDDVGWHHIVGMRKGDDFLIYFDGAPQNLDPTSGAHGTMNATVAELRIGSRTTAPPDYFKGRIDEVAIYNTALSAEIVKEHYDRRTARDNSLSLNNGTINGSASTSGRFDEALQFDGTNDFTSILPINYDEVSISLWFHRYSKDTVNSDTVFGGWYYDSNIQLRQGFDFGRFLLNSDTVTFTLDTKNLSGTVTDRANQKNLGNSVGQWYHIMGTYEKSTGDQKLYVNGQLSHTTTHPDLNTIVPLSNYTDMRIGYSRVNAGYFNGLVDEVAVWNQPIADINKIKEFSVLCYDLSSYLIPEYLGSIPKDPRTGTEADTGYAIYKNTGGAITIQAISPEAIDNQTPEIKASR